MIVIVLKFYNVILFPLMIRKNCFSFEKTYNINVILLLKLQKEIIIDIPKNQFFVAFRFVKSIISQSIVNVLIIGGLLPIYH
jgi:hypothetical protein